jgi:hypothetical protein
MTKFSISSRKVPAKLKRLKFRNTIQDKPYYDPDDPWGGILVAVAFALRSTYHMTLQATPGQLIFGRDMVLNVQHLTDWTAIKACKQQIICKNN